MRVQRLDNLSGLSACRKCWDELTGDCVFRSWTWLSSWWNHYGTSTVARQGWATQRELFVLLVFDDSDGEAGCGCDVRGGCSVPSAAGHHEKLVGVLPCYRERSPQGHILRLLGDGEVCSEDLDLLCRPADAPQVIAALHDYLLTHAEAWDGWEATTLNTESSQLLKLFTSFREDRYQVDFRAGHRCWAIPLPESWEDYLAQLSKSHRKQLRQLNARVLESGQATWRLVSDSSEFDEAWRVFRDLHQRRRHSLGEPGCFASPCWAAFHADVARRLLSEGRLRLSTLALDGQPIAAEYHLAGDRTLYAYQGGIDPDCAPSEPGRLSMICALQAALREGQTTFDLLRGDEPYKPHWRAEPRETTDVRIVAPRLLARCRSLSWRGLRTAGRLVHHLTSLLG